MAKVVKKNTLSVKGILGIDDGIITVEIEDGNTYSLADLSTDFEGKEVSISIGYTDELA